MRILKYTLLTLLWCGVIAYIVFTTMEVKRQRALRIVRNVDIDIIDSIDNGSLVTRRMVDEWIDNSNITTMGAKVDDVDLAGLELMIAGNGFVDDVNASVDYRGLLSIDVSQRRPVLRIMTDGFDSYVTSGGIVFNAPAASSLYVPVVTGGYTPPFPADYSGQVSGYVDTQIQILEQQIAAIETERYPLYEKEQKSLDRYDELRKRIKKGWFESQKNYDNRLIEWRETRDAGRRRYRYEKQRIQADFDKISARQQAERQKQKKLQKNHEDFLKLITFVEQIEDDSFWRAEVVQIVASTTESGAMNLMLIPRSGEHVILFGEVVDIDQKLDKLLRFYRGGLTDLGWDKFSVIDVKYKDQIVCKR